MTATLKIRLSGEQARELLGSPVRLDGHVVGHIEGEITDFDISRGWHVLEVKHRKHPIRPMKFSAKPHQVVDLTAAEAEVGVADRSWFTLQPTVARH